MNDQSEFTFALRLQETGDTRGLPRARPSAGSLRPTRSGHLAAKGPDLGRQGDLSFAGLEQEKGYTQWLAGRRVATDAVAQRLHLPIGHFVEVWLSSGIRLRGKLRLSEEVLFIEEDRLRNLELNVDGVSFTRREMESCVRLD